MKRPEGFDRGQGPAAPETSGAPRGPRATTSARARRGDARQRGDEGERPRDGRAVVGDRSAARPAGSDELREGAPFPSGVDAGRGAPTVPTRGPNKTPLAAVAGSSLLARLRPGARRERAPRASRPVDPAAQARQADRRARAAARAARRAERAEVRRFTRRSRRRRILVLSSSGALVALVAGVGAVTVSPLMALTEITVTGAERLDPAAVTEALDEHTGTPLALLDHGAIRDDLRAFPLIRSYSTEVVPPHTLVVRLVERTPIGAVERADGVALVDAAGVVVDSTAERPPGVPLIEAGDADAESIAFRSAAAVLAALPADLVARIDVISATTRDDVTFSFADTGHRVRWGSAERSDYKARVLAAAIATSDQSVAWQYDVSAPDSLIARRL